MTESMSSLFRPLDLVVIFIYLAAMVALGVFFSRKNKTTEDYFLGNRSFPGWAIGVSLLGTSISSITFLALPAGAYSLDWRMIVPNLTMPVVAVAAIWLFIPLFRRGRAVSAFEYLEQRYGPIARLYGALSFMILQLLRIGLVLMLVSMPLQVLTGISPEVLIIVGGAFIIAYTLLGGIEGVVWTDVAQTLVLLLGGILCLGIIVYQLPGGFSDVFRVGAEHNKFNVGEFRWNVGERTFFTMVITGMFGWVGMYTSDQNVIQRYLAASSTREARKAVALAATMAVPVWAFFFFIGTCLFVYFQTFPNEQVAAMEADQVLPFFILSQIPAGLSGLIIAGILAAAMSTLDSSLNSLSTVFVNDILRRHVMKNRPDSFYLRAAKAFVFVAGVFMILFALFLIRTERESVMDVNMILAAVFGGALGGMYLVGFFTERVGSREMLIGLSVAIIANLYLVFLELEMVPEAFQLKIHSYWAGIVVNGIFAAVAIACSFYFPKKQGLEGLTIWTINAQEKPGAASIPAEERIESTSAAALRHQSTKGSDVMSDGFNQPVRMIIDTDIEHDVDDVGAIAVAHALADRGEAELVGMVVSCGHPWSPLCLSSLNAWYGRPDIPIGFVGERDTVVMGSKYAQGIAERFPGKLTGANQAEHSTALYRRLLAAEEDNSIVLVSIGFMTGIRWLLESGPDDISPLPGRELVARKMKAWVCMGGAYPSGREYNFFKDSESTFRTINDWPTPIYFIGQELGNLVMSGKSLDSLPPDNPTRVAYELYFDGETKDRPSWDQVTVLFAARLQEMLGEEGLWEIESKGGNRVESDGSNQWDAHSTAPHYYLKPRVEIAVVEEIIADLMSQSPALTRSQH